MKDLFVFTADADAQAVVRSILARPQSIGIRPVTWEVDRHTGRDSGMIKDGPEIIRMRVRKTEFSKVILIWDYHGSGWESKPPRQSRDAIRLRLRQVTWDEHSDAVVVVPEIEEWLWRDPVTLARYLGIDDAQLQQYVESFAAKQNADAETCKADYPKELFEYSVYRSRRRKPLPEDFKLIAANADLHAWQTSETFGTFIQILRDWFQ
jgi:hypothetical protein